MHVLVFSDLAALSVVCKALNSADAFAFQDDDEVWHLGVPEDLAEQAEALAASPPAASKAELLAYAADLRWRREVGGIAVAGVSIATDDRSKVMIVGARVAAEANPAWSTSWHGADGQIYPVDATAMIAISAAVEAHVNSGFATFAQVRADIEAGTITTQVEIDEAFA